MHPKLLITFCIVFPLILTVVILAFRMKEEENDVTINLAILVLGACVGWLMGIFMSPYDSGEKAAFAGYASAVATFVSGYLVAKIDPLVTKLFSPEFLFQKVVAFRAASFLSVLLLAMLMTFAIRVYLPQPEFIGETRPNNSKHSDLVKLSPFLFQKSRQLHQAGV